MATNTARLAQLLDDRGAELTLSELALLSRAEARDVSEAVDDFITQSAPEDERRLNAAALIHALAANPDLFEDERVATRKRCLEFIATTFKFQLKTWKVQRNGEDFEFVAELAALPHQVRIGMARGVELLTSLGAIPMARNDIQRVLNTYRPLLAPLVPGPLVRSRVGELLDQARLLATETGTDFLAAYALLTELLDAFEADLGEAGVSAVTLLTPFSETIRGLAEQAYSTNPATEPAQLTCVAKRKRYALNLSDSELRLNVLITNAGPGQALDTRLEQLDADGVELETESVPLGQLLPGTVSATIQARTVPDPTEAALVTGFLSWSNTDGSASREPFEALFEAQRGDISWSSIRQRYHLEPVRSATELVGRGEALRTLVDLVGERSVGSAMITGQKRVGKTSIALTLQSSLAEVEDVIAVHIDAGAFVQPSAERTVIAMGDEIASELGAADPRFSQIEAPKFESTLAPLKQFVGRMRLSAPKARVVVVIDEFDELPTDLFRRGAIGDAFFLALRSLAGLEHIGFVLVGGEKMEAIVDAQGDQLNKFEPIRVTYLDRERHWDDFADLVRLPVADCFEITDEAVVALFELTQGHPYFTKLIGRALFKLAVARHDAFLTEAEVSQAAEDALDDAAISNFIHFWEDGVLGTGEQVEQISVRRRKLLLAFAEVLERGRKDVSEVKERAEQYGLDIQDSAELIREFARRGVLVEDDGQLSARVRLFENWLARHGVAGITTTFTDPDAILHAKQRELELRVQAEEITRVTARWGLYRGAKVTSEDVRAWLNQFEPGEEQRLMYSLLDQIRFYDSSRIRAKLLEAHSVVRRGIADRDDAGGAKRGDIVVAYLGGAAKSGARYARLYADENGIDDRNVAAAADLQQLLTAGSFNALVLIDDILASGDQAKEFLSQLDVQVGGLIRKQDIKVTMLFVVGYSKAQSAVQDAAALLELPVSVHVCDPLGEEDRCFAKLPNRFGTEAHRARAEDIATSYGRRLQRRAPLGYKNVRSLVVFDEGCPNGTLPILWDDSGDWRPLFPRNKRS